MRCPVCEHDAAHPFQTVGPRHYWRCPTCSCTFLQPDQRPGPAAEQAEYRLHQNHPGDAGYRRHLEQLTGPLLQRLPPAQSGLDFGCGPGPVLPDLLRNAGHAVALYDPFFHPDDTAL
ncbi:MAG: class I SAM-dependent methyltransferase, partial [Hydrogenophaga sp.]|nr:class I SAM-dependent methyltransferase [Hydrogenophaga sp.]